MTHDLQGLLILNGLIHLFEVQIHSDFGFFFNKRIGKVQWLSAILKLFSILFQILKTLNFKLRSRF